MLGSLEPLGVIPQLELVALPDEHDALVEGCVLAQGRRYEDATGTVEHHVIGMTDQKALQGAGLLVEARQPHQALLNRLPREQRIEQQTVARIRGEHQPSFGVADERLAMARRDRQTTLVIERKMGNASKHCPSLSDGTMG